MSFGGSRLALGSESVIVGILNVTPDSFSDGGSYMSVQSAVDAALNMFNEGASIIDIGGESTRPGFEDVSANDEIDRVVPVIRGILRVSPEAVLSVDTSKSEVARAAVQAGCSIVNDIWGFLKDRKLPSVAAESQCGVILMRNGRDGESNGSIIDRIKSSWDRSVELAVEDGVLASNIILDPGIGFGTTRQEDLEILQELASLKAYGFPMMLGASRKRITAEPDGLPLSQRLEATLATTAAGIAAGVELFRVHDVAENVMLAKLADLIHRGGVLHG